MAKRRKERTRLEVGLGGQRLGLLQAVDNHGCGRQNKAWIGKIDGEDVDLPNLKAVAAWAKEHGYDYQEPFEP